MQRSKDSLDRGIIRPADTVLGGRIKRLCSLLSGGSGCKSKHERSSRREWGRAILFSRVHGPLRVPQRFIFSVHASRLLAYASRSTYQEPEFPLALALSAIRARASSRVPVRAISPGTARGAASALVTGDRSVAAE